MHADALSPNAQLDLPTWSDSVDDLLNDLGIVQRGSIPSANFLRTAQ